MVRTALYIVLLSSLAACSPVYVMRAAYTEAKILLAREPIEEVIADPERSADEKSKLETVIQARDFAKTMGLRSAFTHYSKVDQDVLTWVVLASKKDSFDLYTWWFPIVGRVPYKGFFDLEDAKREREKLEELGYEVWLRGSDAFSTLGWFNDPVLSTMLKYDHIRVSNTIIHESVHSTIWIKNHVAFNESLANFVGGEGAKQFFLGKPEGASAETDQQREFELAGLIQGLYDELDTLYKSGKSSEERIKLREEVFARHMAAFLAKYPGSKLLRTPNNAEIMQLKLYLTGLLDFEALFKKSGSSWENFFAEIRVIKDRLAKDSKLDPFKVLKEAAA